ncbi:S24 family peptidase [Spirosoma aerophilum]
MSKSSHPADQPAIRQRIRDVIQEKFNDRQGELAAAAGIQPAAISKILNGTMDISYKQLKAISVTSLARLEWLLTGEEPMFHPIGWRPDTSQPTREGEFFQLYINSHKHEFTQKRLADEIGIARSVITDYFKTTTFDSETRQAILNGLKLVTGDETIDEEQVFGPIIPQPNANTNIGSARLVRHVGNFSAEPIAVVPFVPIRARAGIATPQYWSQRLETTRIMQSALTDYEVDPSNPRKSWWIIEVDGDSMEPQLRSRARVLGYYVGRQEATGFKLDKNLLYHLKPGIWAIQYDDEFVIKRVRTNNIEADGGLLLYSDNPPPDPFFIRADSIRHVWFIETVVSSPVR